MKKIFTAVLVTACSFLTGCASIVSGGSQPVSFNSTPPGASIIINGAELGRTPATLELDRSDSYAVSIQLEGYESQSVNITRTMNGWVWGNIVFGGLIGLVVDAASGAMYRLTPEQVSATLGETVASTDGDKVVIAVVLTADPTWQKVGQLSAR